MAINWGIAAGAGAVSYSAAERLRIEREEADRKKEDAEEQKRYKEELVKANEPADLVTRTGLQVTHTPSGQAVYVPVDQAYGLTSPVDSPYKITKGDKDAPLTYHTVTRGLGNSTTREDSPMEAAAAAQEVSVYNSPSAVADRQAAVAARYGKFTEAKAASDLGGVGLKRTAEQQNIDIGKLRIGSLTREETAAALELSSRVPLAQAVTDLNSYEVGSPEYTQKLSNVNKLLTEAHGSVKAAEMMEHTVNVGKKLYDAKIAQTTTALEAAAQTPEKALAYYNKEYKNGETAQIRVNARTGNKEIVHVDEKGNQMGDPLQTWKEGEWDKTAKPKIMSSIHGMARDVYKYELQHRNKLAEIKATGDEHVRYARAAYQNKNPDIKLSPEERSRFEELDKQLQDAGDDPKKLDTAMKAMLNPGQKTGGGNRAMQAAADSEGSATPDAPGVLPLPDTRGLRGRMMDRNAAAEQVAATARAEAERRRREYNGEYTGTLPSDLTEPIPLGLGR